MPYKDAAAKRAYQRRWMAERRAAALAGKTCERCGDADGPFDFHHVDPAEKLTHKVWSLTPAKRDAELAKCIVLCRTCHQDHHAVRLERCQHGHTLDEGNVYVKPDGRRECRPCKARRQREYLERKAAAHLTGRAAA